MTQRTTYALRVQPIADGVPETIRLKKWLKLGLRVFGLRCVEIVEAAATTDAAARRTPQDAPDAAKGTPGRPSGKNAPRADVGRKTETT